jgi:hypothetical protein
MKKLLKNKRFLFVMMFPMALLAGYGVGLIEDFVTAHNTTTWVYHNPILQTSDHPTGKRVDNLQPAAGNIQPAAGGVQ